MNDKTILKQNFKRVTNDGITDTQNDVAGYSIVHADSHDATAKLMQDSPSFEISGAYVEIMEVVKM